MAVFILMLAGCAASNSSSQAEKSQASNSAASKSETESSKAADETKAENSDTANGGKTMIPFCTSGSSGIGSSGDNLEENAGSGNRLEGERLSSSSDIEDWINSL